MDNQSPTGGGGIHRGGGQKRGRRNRRGRSRGPKSEAEQPEKRQGGSRSRGGGNMATSKKPRLASDGGDAPRKVPAKANPNARTTTTTLSQMTDTPFSDIRLLDTSQRALREVLRYELMTRVQLMAIPACLEGNDVIAKAKTGTGKTLGFLIPAVEALARSGVSPRCGQISGLVISPTRELAQQTETEARMLCSFNGYAVQCVVGGTKVRADVAQMERRVPELLIATPGRLNDLLENYGVRTLMTSLRVLIFDEADQLLEMGFRPEIQRILGQLPSPNTRQTLLFSATMPEDVKAIARIAMKSNDYTMIDAVGEDESTHQHIPQRYLVVPPSNLLPELVVFLRYHLDRDEYAKLIVFFPAARLVEFYADVFSRVGFDLLEIHSRKSQSHRTKVSEKFRTASRAILFTSDVSARGMDYPDVTAVCQVGLPANREQYVHRIGRTGRACAEGEGLLLLCDFEQGFLRSVSDLPLEEKAPSDEASVSQIIADTSHTLRRTSPKLVGTAYQAWLGFYNSNLKTLKWSKPRLVEEANYWITEVCQQNHPPALLKRTVGKMGLQNVPGLNVTNQLPGGQNGGGRGGGRGRDGSGMSRGGGGGGMRRGGGGGGGRW